MTRWTILTALVCGTILSGSCASSTHRPQDEPWRGLVPEKLEQQIDTTVAFPDLLKSPHQFLGRIVLFSGIVLSSKLTASRTEIEILELPSDPTRPERIERIHSQGRFLAVQDTFLDPAVVPAGTPLTVIGEVIGAVTKPLDESEYTYPILSIKQLIDWNSVAQHDMQAGSAFYGYPYYYAYPFWWGPYAPYPYWSPYPPVIIQRPPSKPPPKIHKR